MNFLFKNKVVLALIAAGTFHLASQAGTQFDRLQICFAPSEVLKINRSCEEDLVVLQKFYDIKNYAQGLDGFKTEWLKTIKKSTMTRYLPATNPYIPLFALGTLTSLVVAYSLQKNKANELELKFSSELEMFATKAYENWVIGYQRRRIVSKTKEFKAEKIIAKELVSMRSQGELVHLQQVLDKSEKIDDLKFELAQEQIKEKIEELRTKSAEHLDKREKLGKTVKDDFDKDSKSKKIELTEEYLWINQLLNLPFRILSGSQGSGKSTLERFMIRLIKDDGWHIICINPETNPQVWKGVEVLQNIETINQYFANFPSWVKERQSEIMEKGLDEDEYLDSLNGKSGREGKVAIFLMESNTYEAWGINADYFSNFLKQCLTNIRKWGFTVCLTAHSDNQTSISSKLKGFSDMINNAPRVDCIATTNDKGQAVSSGKGLLKIKGIKDPEPKEVKLYKFPKTKDFS
jgi:hypothetical protein